VKLPGNDVRAMIPQIAMSAGTMIACSCKSIVMGKQSNIGPIDPQLSGIPADVVKLEFERAWDEISQDPMRAHLWAPILGRYPPSFVMQCEHAVQWAHSLVAEALRLNMFCAATDAKAKATAVADALSSSQLNKTHSKHLHYEQCRRIGLRIELMEDDQELQDRILTVHHCYIHTTTNTQCLKLVESHEGKAMVRNAPQAFAPAGHLNRLPDYLFHASAVTTR
jgi:hypothetical protein